MNDTVEYVNTLSSLQKTPAILFAAVLQFFDSKGIKE